VPQWFHRTLTSAVAALAVNDQASSATANGISALNAEA
jgi:hypothetical protein